MKRYLNSIFLVGLLAASCAVASAQTGVDDARDIFEIRVYTITSGSMDAFVKWMEGVTKWQESVGMHILGQFAAPEQNRYVWIRKYRDEADRQKLFAAVYDSGGMKQFGTPPGYEGGDVFLARAAKYSKLQFDAAAPKAMAPPAGGPVIYETRIYNIRPGSGDAFAQYMGERMIPWQENAWKARILAQLLPYARVTGTANGGKVTPEDRTYIWIRVFPNEATRVEQYKMYQDPAFAKVGPPGDAGFEKANIIIRANPTRFSKLQ